jgi:hypothetical protein
MSTPTPAGAAHGRGRTAPFFPPGICSKGEGSGILDPVGRRKMPANLNTGRALDEIEQVLLAGAEPDRCREAMAILRRWQWDHDLDEGSRSRATGLVRQFRYQYRFR